MSDSGFVREVYDASYRRLVAQLFALCGDQAEAEDAVREAFVKAIGRARQLAAVDNPEAWLHTVALNHVRNRWRHLAVVRRVLPKMPGAQHAVDLSPDQVAIVSALREIPWELRDVITLHHIGDLPVREVARTLGIPEGTVKARLVKGRALLAELLTDTEESNHV